MTDKEVELHNSKHTQCCKDFVIHWIVSKYEFDILTKGGYSPDSFIISTPVPYTAIGKDYSTFAKPVVPTLSVDSVK